MSALKDIAEACNVSIATVSKALNGYADIGSDTVKRIKETAAKLNYQPNPAARMLKTNRSYNIGIVFEDETATGLTHEYFSHILNAAKNALEKKGYDITFISAKIGGHSFLDHCRYRNVDGVLIASVDFTNPQVIELVQSEIPTITIDYVFDAHSCVMSDNIKGSYELTKYLISQGHTKIAIIHGEKTSVTVKRLSGFHKACQEAGLNIPSEYIKESRYHDVKMTSKVAEELLNLKDRPTVIYFPDDYSAIGCRSLFEKKGLRIPEDISICGYDGIPLSQVAHPYLTTIHQKAEEIGEKAGNKLIEMINAGNKEIVEEIVVRGELLKGETVKNLCEIK